MQNYGGVLYIPKEYFGHRIFNQLEHKMIQRCKNEYFGRARKAKGTPMLRIEGSAVRRNKAGYAPGPADWPPDRVPRTSSLLLDHLYLHLIVAEKAVDFHPTLLSLQRFGR